MYTVRLRWSANGGMTFSRAQQLQPAAAGIRQFVLHVHLWGQKGPFPVRRRQAPPQETQGSPEEDSPPFFRRRQLVPFVVRGGDRSHPRLPCPLHLVRPKPVVLLVVSSSRRPASGVTGLLRRPPVVAVAESRASLCPDATEKLKEEKRKLKEENDWLKQQKNKQPEQEPDRLAQNSGSRIARLIADRGRSIDPHEGALRLSAYVPRSAILLTEHLPQIETVTDPNEREYRDVWHDRPIQNVFAPSTFEEAVPHLHEYDLDTTTLSTARPPVLFQLDPTIVGKTSIYASGRHIEEPLHHGRQYPVRVACDWFYLYEAHAYRLLTGLRRRASFRVVPHRHPRLRPLYLGLVHHFQKVPPDAAHLSRRRRLGEEVRAEVNWSFMQVLTSMHGSDFASALLRCSHSDAYGLYAIIKQANAFIQVRWNPCSLYFAFLF